MTDDDVRLQLVQPRSAQLDLLSFRPGVKREEEEEEEGMAGEAPPGAAQGQELENQGRCVSMHVFSRLMVFVVVFRSLFPSGRRQFLRCCRELL